VLKGEFSAGMLVAFIAYADQFHRRGAALIDRWNEFRMLELHAERVADIALSEPETHLEAVHAEEIENTRSEVRNLSFRYAEGEPWVLEHFNLTVEPGESVAIAAPSGAGKTTLAKLILGCSIPRRERSASVGSISISSAWRATVRRSAR
jgi:ATP-binding cassette subfamily B protein RaxB